jgi:hypothetical protein
VAGFGDRAAGFPGLDHGFEALHEVFELTDGGAHQRRQHGVLDGVFGDGGDQQGDDRGKGLAQLGGRGRMHS